MESLANVLLVQFFIAILKTSFFKSIIVLKELYLNKCITAFLESRWSYFSSQKPDIGKMSQLRSNSASAVHFPAWKLRRKMDKNRIELQDNTMLKGLHTSHPGKLLESTPKKVDVMTQAQPKYIKFL